MRDAMTGPLQVLMTAGPLAIYFYVLAIWQGGRHPRVVSGTIDAALLAFGVGGLLTFGPFGHLVLTMFFGVPTVLHWVGLTLLMVLVGASWARWSAHRLVVYHVDPEVFDRVMRELLDLREERYVRTFDGFEDRARRIALKVQIVPLLGTAVIEAIGRDAGPEIRELIGRLRARLERAPTPTTAVASILYSLSTLTMLVSMGEMFLTQSRAREALRVLIQRLQGG
jgi:hypothetical protein